MTAAYYQNFKFDNPTTTLSIIIWGMYIGFMIGGALSVYNKGYLGEVIRCLAKRGINSPEKAIELDKMGIRMSWLRRRNICAGGVLSRYVIIANPEECLIKKKPLSPVMRIFGITERKTEYDATKAKVYLLEKKRIQAELRYSNKGTNIVVFLISAAAFLVLAVALTFAIPYLLDLLDSTITMYKNLFPAEQ